VGTRSSTMHVGRCMLSPETPDHVDFCSGQEGFIGQKFWTAEVNGTGVGVTLRFLLIGRAHICCVGHLFSSTCCFGCCSQT
jgi:hypothetical protein